MGPAATPHGDTGWYLHVIGLSHCVFASSDNTLSTAVHNHGSILPAQETGAQ